MEIREGERNATDDVIFQRIGVPVPVSRPEQRKFDAQSAPLQAIALSNHFGLTFVAHPQGFCVVKTTELIRLANDLKNNQQKESTVQELSIVDVSLAGIGILALSRDDLILVVSVEGWVHFFRVPELVHKVDVKPFQSELIFKGQCVKEFIWSTCKENAYLALSSEGVLVSGKIGFSFDYKEENVMAADWSPDGQHIALLRNDSKLRILSSDFQKEFHLQLAAELQTISAEDGSKRYVDSIKWVRTDCMVIGSVRVDEEGEESEYPVYLLTSRTGSLSEDSVDVEMVAFDPLFSSIDASILPPKRGPYLFLNYMDVWELAVVANRRNIDDHIVLLGWVLENGRKQTLSLEIFSDKWLPRIELQENLDANIIVGIAMDRTCTDSQISFPTDDGGVKELPPCPVLLCMTIEGKLNLFSFSRIDETWHVPQLVFAPTNVPIPHSLVEGGKKGSEVKISSSASSDLEMLATKEDSNAKTLPINKQERETVKVEYSSTFEPQKASDVIKPIPIEKGPSVTPAGKDTDVIKPMPIDKAPSITPAGNSTDVIKPIPIDKAPSITSVRKEIDASSGISQASKHEHDLVKVKVPNEFQGGKTYDALQPELNDKPTPITVKTKEADINAKMPQASTEVLDIENVEDLSKFQLKKSNVPVKPMPGDESFSVSNQTQERQDIQKIAGMFSSEAGTFFQTIPKTSLSEDTISTFASSAACVPNKSGSEVGAFPRSESISTRANESGTSFSTMSNLNSTFPNKAVSTGPSNMNILGKGSVQSSGHFSTSSISSSKSVSTAGGKMGSGGLKDAYHGKSNLPGAVGAFCSTNFPTTSLSASAIQSGAKANVSSTPLSEVSRRTTGQPIMQQKSESLKPSGASKADVQLTGRPFGISEIEADFSRELEKVRNMAKEVDDIMSNIEGDRMVSKASNASFKKHLVMNIEDGIKKLSENCKASKERLEEQFLNTQNLRDKTMQVDAWRIYMQSIIKQATDIQYQYLRSRQKLNPELETKRQRILKEDRRLKRQIIDLEGHLQNLEINNLEEQHDGAGRRHPKQLQNARQLQSLQSFYSTVNSQLVIAEQLAECLSQQMEALNISLTPDKVGKSRNTKDLLFKSIGLSPGESCFPSDMKEKVTSPRLLQKFTYSPSLSTSKESPIQKQARALMLQEPDSVRRRRDPIDNAWANVGTTRTTVKRVSVAPSSMANANKPWSEPTESKFFQLRASSEMFGEEESKSTMFKYRPSEGKNQLIESTKAKGPNIPRASTMPSESSSESFFKWSNDGSQSPEKVSSQASTNSLKSLDAESRSYHPHINIIEDKTFRKHSSDSNISSSAVFVQPKVRAPNRNTSHGLMVGNQSEGLTDLKSTTMQVSSGSMTQTSFGFPKLMTSGGSALKENASKIDERSKLSTKPNEPASSQINALHVDSATETPESIKTRFVPVTSPPKLGGNFQHSSLLRGPSLFASSMSCTEHGSTSAESSAQDSEVATMSSSAVHSGSHSVKPFVFSMPTVSATAGQNLAVSYGSSLSSGEVKSSLNPLPAANTGASSGPDVRTMIPQVPSFFSSKPQNAVVTEATPQPKISSSSMPSFTTSGGKSIAVSSGISSMPSKISAPTITQSNLKTSGLGGRPDTSMQSESVLVKASPPGLSSSGFLSSPNLSSSTVTSVSSLAHTSVSQVSPSVSSLSTTSLVSLTLTPVSQVSQVSPFMPSSSQQTPVFGSLSTSPAIPSASAFSFPSTTTLGFGQFSAPISGSSGPNASTNFGFSSSTSIPISSQQSHATSSFGESVASMTIMQQTPTPINSFSFGQNTASGSLPVVVPAVTNEEDMEEEATTSADATNFGGFSGLGLGSTTPITAKSNPFGGGPLITGQSNPVFSLSAHSGELFRPASFSLPSAQSSTQSTPNPFSGSFGTGGGISPIPATASAFGQPAQPGAGQQALGSALGAFGQSRQIGLGSGVGAGFTTASPVPGSGFTAAASSGGFAGVASGVGFARVAGGGGFGAAASGGGFAGAANAAGGGFAGAGAGSGFQSFGGSGFSSFGTGSPSSSNPHQNLFTQMRK